MFTVSTGAVAPIRSFENLKWSSSEMQLTSLINTTNVKIETRKAFTYDAILLILALKAFSSAIFSSLMIQAQYLLLM